MTFFYYGIIRVFIFRLPPSILVWRITFFGIYPFSTCEKDLLADDLNASKAFINTYLDDLLRQ
jgi:hypothetical protein